MENREKDYYKILGITEEEKNLNQDEFNKVCKRNFKKLAIKYHPDKLSKASEEERKKGEEKFKEISEAYDVLSTPEKRRRYDNNGLDIDLEDIFSNFGFNPFNAQNRQRVNKGSDINASIFVTLKESFSGVKKQFVVERETECKTCHGTGSSDGTITTCSHCHGTGMFSERMQMGPNSFSVRQGPCPYCNATGKIVKNPCKDCNGTGVKHIKTTEEYFIPKGVINGLTLNIKGKGNAPINGEGINGDLVLKVFVKEDSYFKKVEGLNLIHYAEIPFNECLLGFEKEFEAIDGSKVIVKAPELTPDGKAFIFNGKGLPHLNDNNIVGDYAIIVKYVLPDSLTDEQKEKLKNF